MDTFEDLGLRPELVEALLAEGIEFPTALQREAIPVLRKGNPALLRASPGGGLLLTYGAALLDRLQGGEGRPRALVLTPVQEGAVSLARSLARPAAAVSLRVAALDRAFALPALADLLFATPRAAAAALAAGELKLDLVSALVLDGAASLLAVPGDRERVEELLELLASQGPQVVLAADPVTPEVRGFVSERVRRAVHLPSDAAAVEGAGASPIRRGTVRVLSLEGEEGDALGPLVRRLLEEGAAHVLLFFRSEDRAADLGDLVALHGFACGAPGDGSVPVWLAVDAMEARGAAESRTEVVPVSVDVPADPDALDRRHGGFGAGGVVLARPREAAHLRRIAAEAGYDLTPLPDPPGEDPSGREALTREVERAMEELDLGPYHLLLETAVARHGSAEVAAALAALLRRRTPPAGAAPRRPVPGEAAEGPGRGARPSPPAFVRLFFSIGSQDGVGPGDILGAITGETGIPGSRVGKIEVRDRFSRVEVEGAVAEEVIRRLNGTTVRGRSLRVDYDRARQRPPGPGRKPPRRG
jgi:ATP-dependent RNA helicase DeaD